MTLFDLSVFTFVCNQKLLVFVFFRDQLWFILHYFFVFVFPNDPRGSSGMPKCQFSGSLSVVISVGCDGTVKSPTKVGSEGSKNRVIGCCVVEELHYRLFIFIM